ncbi:hypothetical protein EXU85_25980 [Spirosoma sp. KCTC 42546]|uniref:hypothetical protein n=1 Tax=Spirosoma sp. KCTC 42546 TaxID=2520506 RepID=UPI001159CF44|nr:hypothetical protein [Spirosoma sp. KCTC 42546]QDK81871.1 hypothetical protein EXU85_25980 [Spirosoma sp. KCTC 42546]
MRGKPRCTPQRLSYRDYIRAVTSLQESTKNRIKIQTIFKAILQQASQLAKSSEWVERDLRFEALAEFIEDRRESFLLDLAHGGVVDDGALDLYNERASRFT